MENVVNKDIKGKQFNFPIDTDLHNMVAEYIHKKKMAGDPTTQKIIGTALLNWFFGPEMDNAKRDAFIQQHAK